MSVGIVEEDSPEALLAAAQIWPAATARRDGLSEPVPAEQKLPVSAALENWTVSAVKSEHSTIGE